MTDAGVRGLWAVRFRPEGLPWEPDFAYHAFLLLTVGRGTKVLQTGEELSEMQAAQVDFVLDKPTILAVNLLSWARTVQVGALWLIAVCIACSIRCLASQGRHFGRRESTAFIASARPA